MRILKKIVIAIGIIIVLAIVKIMLIRMLPASQVFHFNMISCIQLMLLSWAVITGFFETAFSKYIADGWRWKWSAVFFVCLLGLGELLFTWMFYHPRFIPSRLLPAFRYYYNNYQRDILQYNRTMTAYDPKVFYKMLPDNRFLFGNAEFSDSFYTDKMGFRDDDRALQNKKIICLGDSYTLGWGVHQQEVYPRLLGKILSVPVLNTGMSSYGTAREVESVRTLDMSTVQNVVIQYCYNDAEENQAFVNNDNKLPISPKSVFDSACNELYWSKRYFPGKYFFTISKLYLRDQVNRFRDHTKGIGEGSPGRNAEKYKIMAENFIAVLSKSGWDFKKIHIWVFDIAEFEMLNDWFLQALEKELQKSQNAGLFCNHIQCLHVTRFLTASDYYLLDGHIQASGHEKIALALSNLIRENGKQ